MLWITMCLIVSESIINLWIVLQHWIAYKALNNYQYPELLYQALNSFTNLCIDRQSSKEFYKVLNSLQGSE